MNTDGLNTLMKQKITVIGGAGFVGTNLCRELNLKKKIFEIIDIKISKEFPNRSKFGDVRDITSLRNAITGNVVVNLAAAHRDDIQDHSIYYRTNVVGAENIAKVCSEKGIKKILFTSSVAVYGFSNPGADENGQINPFNDYGKTKLAAENKFRDWQLRGNNSLIIIRPTVIFGEGNRGNVFNLLNQIASRKFIMIGHGNNKKSMAYIGNVVLFLLACIEIKKKYAVYNYVDKPDLTMNDLVSQVRKKLIGKDGVGLRLPYKMGIIIGYLADLISMITRINLPISLIRIKKFTSSTEFQTSQNSIKAFTPKFDLVEGIDRTINSEFLNSDPNREIFITE